jgi:DNA repair protein RadC
VGSIKSQLEDSRPRERLMTYGQQSLSNSELLAIVLGSGTRDYNVLRLAADIMNDCGNDLNELSRNDYTYYMRYKGVGTAKAITIAAVFELARRRRDTPNADNPLLTNPQAVYEHIAPILCDLNHEEMWAMYLNAAGRLTHKQKIASGTRTAVVCDPKDIIRPALTGNTASVIIAHNHPSGNRMPSVQDDTLTQKVAQAAKVFDLKLNDHIIIARDGYFSYATSKPDIFI